MPILTKIKSFFKNAPSPLSLPNIVKAAAAVVFVFLFRRRLLPLFLLAGCAAVPLLPDSILSRLLSIFNFHDTSISSRFPIYEASFKAIAANPVLGVGLGSELAWAPPQWAYSGCCISS